MNATYGRKRLFRWGAGVILAGFLAGGGIALAAASGGPGTAGGAGAASGPAGQEAATLNSVLGTAASTTAVPAPRVRWALARLRALGGVDGTVTFHNKTGFHTLAFERGTIRSAGGGDVVVRAANGTTWTWRIVGDTVVRKNGSKTTTGALSAGETVFAAGPVADGARDARLIVIRTGSESAQTSLS
jgi:hypothetical protein